MRQDFTTHTSPIRTVHPGIFILSGIVSVNVDAGQLRIKAGAFENRPELWLSKATSRLSRLILIGHTGTISLKALRWIHDVGAAVIQIDHDATVVMASAPPKVDNAKLRRAQALAATNGQDMDIARKVIKWKVEGQAEVCTHLNKAEAAELILELIPQVEAALSKSDLLSVEAQAAALYWNAWSEIPIRFTRRDQKRVPEHWKSYTGRVSPLTNSPRKAANPANAMLNYLYALLEAETRIAILTMGLDPGIGVLHADHPGRDSLIYDLMEPVRPQVDRWLYELIHINTFTKSDFYETPEGQIMIRAPLTRELSATTGQWAKAVAPVVEWIANVLNRRNAVSKKHRTNRIATPLTEANRSEGRSPYRKKQQRRKRNPKLAIKACRECGETLERDGGEFCSKRCWEAFNEAIVVPKFAEAGPKNLAMLRAIGKDPSHGGEAAKKRGQSNARRAHERKQWEKDHPDINLEKERERFKKEILPYLAYIPLSRIIGATGLSKRYASMIRRDLYTPHPIHYQKLEELILLYNEAEGG